MTLNEINTLIHKYELEIERAEKNPYTTKNQIIELHTNLEGLKVDKEEILKSK